MKIYYISPSRLYFAIDEDGIFQIAKQKEKAINPHAIRLERLRVTIGDTHCTRDCLFLSGKDLLTLVSWWMRSGRRLNHTFDALFDGSTGGMFFEVVRAMWRIIYGREDEAFGETRHFLNEQLRIHGPDLLAMRRQKLSH